MITFATLFTVGALVAATLAQNLLPFDKNLKCEACAIGGYRFCWDNTNTVACCDTVNDPTCTTKYKFCFAPVLTSLQLSMVIVPDQTLEIPMFAATMPSERLKIQPPLTTSTSLTCQLVPLALTRYSQIALGPLLRLTQLKLIFG